MKRWCETVSMESITSFNWSFVLLCSFHCLWFTSTPTNELVLSPAAGYKWLWAGRSQAGAAPEGQKISQHDLRLHANLCCCGEKRLSWSSLSRPVGFASSPMMVQLICLLCFSRYMQRKKLPNDDLLAVTLEGHPGGPQELLSTPRTRTCGNVIQPYSVILYNMPYMLVNLKFWGRNRLFPFRCVSWEAPFIF